MMLFVKPISTIAVLMQNFLIRYIFETENYKMSNIIKANEGKIFRRISDGTLYGKQISLGYSYYINGVKLAKPHLDVPEDFE